MKLGNIEILVEKGDITKANTQSIVNAANNEFRMGGGVALAIKKKGGNGIEEEAVKQGPVEVGESVVTKAGNLKAEYVIHAATMALDFKTNSEYIRKAAFTALAKAQENGISSISFPALGAGVGRFSAKDSAKIMSQEVFKYFRETKSPSLKRIVFYFYGDKGFEEFRDTIIRYLEHLDKKTKQGPFVTVDGIVEYESGVVLVQRKNPPFGWAIPGGFVDYGESVEESVVREVKEETNLDFVDFKQFKTYSDPQRDPRFHTVSVAFTGTGLGGLKAASDAKDAKVFKLDELPEDMAFDHRRVLEEYKKYTG